MRRTKIKRNGSTEDEYEIQRSPLEIGLAVALFGGVLGFGAWLSLGQIQLGREMVGVSSDVKSIHNEIAIRVAQRDAEYAQLKQSDEEMAQKLESVAESLATIHLRLAMSGEMSEANQPRK